MSQHLPDVLDLEAAEVSVWDRLVDDQPVIRSASARVQARKLHHALRAVGWVISEVAPDASWWLLDRGDGRRLTLARHGTGLWYVQVTDRRAVLRPRNPFQRRSFENRAEVQVVDCDHRLLEGPDGRRTMTALDALAVAARYAAENPRQRAIGTVRP